MVTMPLQKGSSFNDAIAQLSIATMVCYCFGSSNRTNCSLSLFFKL
jgi:hypothetical protein